jgi:hypothetical protein
MNTTSNNYSIDLKSRVINEYNKNILSVIGGGILRNYDDHIINYNLCKLQLIM